MVYAAVASPPPNHREHQANIPKSLHITLLGHASLDEDFTYAFGLYRLQAYFLSLDLPHELRLLDRKVNHDEDDDLRLVLDGAPDIVGLSAFLWNLPRVVRLVSRLRAQRPELLIVVGGPSAKGYDDLATDAARPDLLVVGPGEVTFANIVRAYADDRLDASLDSLGNIVSYRHGAPVSYGSSPVTGCLRDRRFRRIVAVAPIASPPPSASKTAESLSFSFKWRPC